MLFYFLRFWLTLAVRAWYKRAYVHFESAIPNDAPVIFASTHPNSAIDYLFSPLIHRRRTYVLVRGDVFEKPILNRIFRSIFMLPVYRFRDGFSSLNRNQQSFKECFSHFDRNGKVLIFSEGICIQKKELQPLQKGTARLALDYIEKHGGKEIYIVPLATSYTRFRFFRSSAMVNFGQPIAASEYRKLYSENANKAYEKLTSDISDSLRKNYIIQTDYSDNSRTEKALMALRLSRNESRNKWVIEDRSFFNEEKQLTELLNHENRIDDTWMKQAEEVDLTPRQEGLTSSSITTIGLVVRLILLTPIVALAGLTVLIPFSVSRWLIRARIKDIIFDNTVTILGSAVLYIFQWFILLFIGLYVWGLPGVSLALGGLLITMLGIEVVDEYLFAWHNWKRVSNREQFRALHEAVRAQQTTT